MADRTARGPNEVPPGRTARGAGDADLHAAIGKAIRSALAGLDGGQSELARRIGVSQPEISKLGLGRRPTPLNIWEMMKIEEATGRPHGYILQEIGYLPRERGSREAIAGDPDLDETGRAIVLAALDAAAGRAPGAASSAKIPRRQPAHR